MSEIWGVFDMTSRLCSTRTSEALAIVGRNIADAVTPHLKPHTVDRIYTAAEVRAILHDMPDAAARFEVAK